MNRFNVKLRIRIEEDYEEAMFLFDEMFTRDGESGAVIFNPDKECEIGDTKHTAHTIKGPSQGDVMNVIIPEQYDNKETLEFIKNLAWYAPYVITIKVNGEVFNSYNTGKYDITLLNIEDDLNECIYNHSDDDVTEDELKFICSESLTQFNNILSKYK